MDFLLTVSLLTATALPDVTCEENDIGPMWCFLAVQKGRAITQGPG